MGFDAAQVLKPLEYNFNPHFDLEGTIKEPTDRQVDAFTRAMRAEIRRTFLERGASQEDAEKISDAEFLALLDKADQRSTEETLKRQAKIYADLCSGSPSVVQLLKVPPRVRLAFFMWLRDEIFNPEMQASAGVAQVTTLKSVAGG